MINTVTTAEGKTLYQVVDANGLFTQVESLSRAKQILIMSREN